MTSNTKYIVSGASNAFVIRIIGVALGFILQVVCARVMPQSDFGVYVYLISLMSVLSVVARFGLDSSLPRFLPVFQVKQQWGEFSGALILALVMPVGIALVMGVALCLVGYMPVLAGSFKYSELFWGVALLVPIVSLLDILRSALLSLKVVRQAEMLRSVLRPVCIIGLFLLAYSIWGTLGSRAALLLHVAALSATVCVGCWILLRVAPGEIRRCSLVLPWRDVIRVSLPMLLMASFSILISELTVIFLGWQYPPEQVAVYGVCVRIASLAAFALQATNSIMNPLISELYFTERHDDLQKALSFSACISILVTVVLVSFLIIMAKFILGIFGDQYIKGYNILIILIVSQFINAASGPVGSVMKMTGKHNQSFLIMFGTMTFSLIVGYTLIRNYGIYGAAVTNILAMSIWNGAMLLYVIKIMKLNPTVIGMDKNYIYGKIIKIINKD